jgi:23S rRNA (guanosine2251-2'-O)-methyltransferase
MTKSTQNVQKELVYGVHAILELLKAKKRKLYSIYTTKPTPKAWDKIEELLPKYTMIQYVDKRVLNKMADSEDHQNILGLASPFVTRNKMFDPKKNKFLVLLDGIQDTKNLGAILRSAYCTSVDGVIVTLKNSAPISAAAIKSSAGLAEHLEILQTSSVSQAVVNLKESGYHIYLATVDNSKPVDKVDYKFPLCVVIGNEATGISKSILNSGEHISLPQKRADISYNASVAAGIIMFNIAIKNQIL